MTEHPNAQTYRSLLQAFQGGDVNAIGRVLAPDVVWHEAGNPQPLQGRDAVVERLGGFASAELDISESQVHDVLASDDHVVAMLQAVLRHGDRRVSYPVVEVAHVRDGLVAERWAMMDAVPDDVAAFFAALTG